LVGHTKYSGGWLLTAILSVTAGAVDTIGFLALGGLFTAHITGNVVVAAHYVTGGFGEIGPLLAVPVFVVVLGAVTLASVEAERPFSSGQWLSSRVGASFWPSCRS